VAVARSSSDGVAIHYELPVVWMTSCFHILQGIGQNQRRRVYFLQFTRCRHWGRSLPTPTASSWLCTLQVVSVFILIWLSALTLVGSVKWRSSGPCKLVPLMSKGYFPDQVEEETRVVHGSILCDPIQPGPSAEWPNPTHYKWKTVDPTQPNTTNNGAYSLVVTYFYTENLSLT